MDMKEAFQKKYQAQLDEWAAEIQKMKAKAGKAEAEIQLEYYKHIEKLQDRHKAVSEKLDNLKEKSGDAWEDLKDGLENAYEDLSKGMKSAWSRFK